MYQHDEGMALILRDPADAEPARSFHQTYARVMAERRYTLQVEWRWAESCLPKAVGRGYEDMYGSPRDFDDLRGRLLRQAWQFQETRARFARGPDVVADSEDWGMNGDDIELRPRIVLT